MFTRIARKWIAFRRARNGTAALEFAIVILPFFLLTVGLAEISMIGFAQTSLDFAVSETARQIRTGQAQMNGMNAQDVKDELCAGISNFLVLDCESNLYIDVDRFNSFVDAGSGNTDPIQNNTFSPTPGYSPGAPSDIVVVRAYYRWEILTPLFEPVFENVSGGQRILVSTMMFRNEPYQT